MADSELIGSLGMIMLEIGAILFLSLIIAFVFRRVGIPAILGLLVGGVMIGLVTDLQEYVFSSNFDLLRMVIIELALGFIAYDIGNDIDLRLLYEKGPRFGLILLAESMTPFVLVTGAIFLFSDIEVGVAMIFGAIAITTAPTVTSQILGDFNARGELAQAILFMLVFDSIVAILLVNVAVTITTTSGTAGLGGLVLAIFRTMSVKISISVTFAALGTGVIYILLKRHILEEKSLVEWLMGLSLIIVGASLFLGGSVILSMLAFGMFLKTLETREGFEILHEHVLQIELLMVPVVLMFYVLMGLEIHLSLLVSVGTVLLVFLYFASRVVGKVVGPWVASQFSEVHPNVKRNLHLSLITQSGIAVALAGLAYNQLTDIGEPDLAKLVLTVVGVSVIISELVGPLLLRRAIARCIRERENGLISLSDIATQ